MGEGWNAMAYDGKDNLLRVLRGEGEGFLALAAQPGVWEAPTGSAGWQVRDIVGHLVDTTEEYLASFGGSPSGGGLDAPYGLPGMAERVNTQAQAFRGTSQEELVERLGTAFTRMMETFEGLDADQWGNLTVPHFYMGPLPAFFYPAFQLMDYAVHSWDIRQGTGRAHGLAGEAADLLVPFMFVLWQATTTADAGKEPCEVGVRVTSGPNAGDTLVRVGPEGMAYEPGDASGAAATVEFDPGSFVLTAFGRSNAGSIRGDAATADRYLNLFFRI
jgi:uncharacterized protein (TIGR03083 family)